MTAGGHRPPLQQVSFWISSPVGAKESLNSFAPPVLTPLTAYNPGLAPGATLSRRSAAVIRMRFARLQVHSANFFVYASVYGEQRSLTGGLMKSGYVIVSIVAVFFMAGTIYARWTSTQDTTNGSLSVNQ